MLRLSALGAAAVSAVFLIGTPATAGNFSWSGLYIGAHAGYGTGDVDADLSHTTGAVIYSDPFSPDQRKLDGGDGWFGGFQAGANYQRGQFVIGIEADASWTDIDASGTFATTSAGPCSPNSCTQWKVDTELQALGTIRGRLGIASGHTLFYGTGGLAWAITDSDEVTHHNGPAFATPGAVVSGDSNHIGYAIGGGAEVALGQGWSLKGEYLFLDLGEADYHLTGVTAPGSSTPWAESFSQDIELHTFRVGLNYKFGEREAPAPLK